MDKDIINETVQPLEKNTSFSDYELVDSDKKEKVLVFKTNNVNTISFEPGKSYDIDIKVSDKVSVSINLSLRPGAFEIDRDLHSFPGNSYYICKNMHSNRFFISAIVSEKNYNLVSPLLPNTNRIITAINTLNISSEDAKAEIRSRLARAVKRYDSNSSNADHFGNYSIKNLRALFDMTRSLYSPTQQNEIEQVFNEVREGDRDSVRNSTRKLKQFFSITIGENVELNISKEEIISMLGKKVYIKSPEQLSLLTDYLIDIKHNKGAKQNILVVGPPGCGKTKLGQTLADILDCPCLYLSCTTIGTKDDIAGTNSVYNSSHPGIFFDSIYNNKNDKGFVICDEFDAIFNQRDTSNGAITPNIFNDVLGDQRRFKDNFIDISLSTENLMFFATANSLDNIPEATLNRFLIIRLDGFDANDRVVVARDYILPELFEQRDLGDFALFSDDILHYISESFSTDLGLRDLKKNIEVILYSIESSYERKSVGLPVTVTEGMVDSVLGKHVTDDNPVVFYRRHFDIYSESTKREIENIIGRLHDKSFTADMKDKLESKLKNLVYCIPTGDAFENVDYDSVKEALDKNHYGMKKAKERILSKLFTQSNGKGMFGMGAAILLTGPFGGGKTTLAEAISRALNAPLIRVNCNGIVDIANLKGHSFTYVGAESGMIVKQCANRRTTKGVILFDEIEKMTAQNGTANPQAALVDFLDGKASFHDVFCDANFDFSQSLVIATCNDLSRLLPVLRDRFEVIELEGYTDSEKKTIAQNYVIPQTLSEMCLKFDILFSDEAADSIVARCSDAGARGLTKAIRKIIEETAVRNRHRDTKSIEITPEEVEDILGPLPIPRGNYPETAHPGLVKGLAVSGNSGMVFAIDTVVFPGKEELIITGLTEQDVSESARRCISYIKQNYPGALDNKTIHVDFAEGSIKKSGSSAGAATCISILSALFDITAAQDCAITGEFGGLHGSVYAVGGIREKVGAAIKNGCKKVFIPYQNKDDEGLKEIDTSAIEVIPVKHIDEIIKVVLPELKK